jgi:hypothetical protein
MHTRFELITERKLRRWAPGGNVEITGRDLPEKTRRPRSKRALCTPGGVKQTAAAVETT